MNVPPATAAKRPYHSPKLMVYGTVREITANTSSNPTHRSDGGIFFLTKTG
jgi:hypothetical protein